MIITLLRNSHSRRVVTMIVAALVAALLLAHVACNMNKPNKSPQSPQTQPIASAQANPPQAQQPVPAQVRELENGVIEVHAGELLFTVDTKTTGFIRDLSIGKKQIMKDNMLPPLVASMFESKTYDGWSDLTDSQAAPASYRLHSSKWVIRDGVFTLRTGAVLAWGEAGSQAPTIDSMLTITADPRNDHLSMQVDFAHADPFKNCFLRELAMQMPLALNHRMRVVQGGDRGIFFNTRSFYQYMFHVDMFPEPEHNFWQHFYVDQATPNDYQIWRSESLATSGLSMFRGRAAPGWMTAYDQGGGMTFAYKDMAKRAPKCVYVNASQVAGHQGATAKVYFHGPMHAAIEIDSPQARQSIFGGPHQIDLLMFKGESKWDAMDAKLAKVWNEDKLASQGPVRADPAIDKIQLYNAASTGPADSPYVEGGLPFAQGQLTKPDNVVLVRDGQPVPIQTKPIGFWPDGSIKWLLLVFPLQPDGVVTCKADTTKGDRLPFVVTLRNGPPQDFVLLYGQDVRPGQTTTPMVAGELRPAQPPVVAGATNPKFVHAYCLDTGNASFALGAGKQWLGGVSLGNKELLAKTDQPTSFVDYFTPDGNYPVGTTHPHGTPDVGDVNIEKLTLEEQGPLRAVVKLEGWAKCSEPARVIIRVEAYANRPWLRIINSTEFLHTDARKSFVRQMGLNLPLNLGDGKWQVIAGGQDGPVNIPDGAMAGLRQTTHLNYEAWSQQDGEHHIDIAQSGNRSRGWLAVGGKDYSVAAVVRNMWQEFPKEIVADQKEHCLKVYFRSPSMPLMDVRRYSNYPHLSQGESAGTDANEIAKWYYSGDPWGVSKTDEVLLVFGKGFSDGQAGGGRDQRAPSVESKIRTDDGTNQATLRERIDAIAADFNRQPLAYAGAGRYLQTKVMLPDPAPDSPDFARTNHNVSNIANFLLFHQKYWGWYGMWDYGDVLHNFKHGYGKMVDPDAILAALRTPPGEREQAFKESGFEQDYWPQHDWTFDNGRWGWSNTEGLCNLFMQTQYLRTGDRDIYFFIEAMARQVRDVTMRHPGSRFFGSGTRHGVQHWSDGDHEERQTTHSEFRYHYFLSGDQRTNDFSSQLAENVYLTGTDSGNANHSGRLYGLLTRWEMTGDKDIGHTLENYIHALTTPEGISTVAPVKFPQGLLAGAAEDVNDESMFFVNFGALHALLEYYELTHDSALRQALVQYAKDGRGPNMAVAFAARYADDPAPYRKALADRIKHHLYGQAYQWLSDDRANWTGLTAPEFHFPYLLFWANEELYTMGALPKEPMPSKAQIDRMKRNCLYQGPPQRQDRGSWQDQYDRQDMKEYCTPTRPIEP